MVPYHKKYLLSFWTFALSGRWDDGMTFIPQGVASLALGYGQALGLQPAVIVNELTSKRVFNTRPERADVKRS